MLQPHLLLIPALLAAFSVGCAKRLSSSDLDRVSRPAFLSRIEENAGPRALVFREDNHYAEKLGRLSAKEADRRLTAKLQKSTSRFEVSDRIRSATINHLPKVRPWTQHIDPVQVAGALSSFLVEEVPANAPDYELLRPLGTDSVVEFVVEEYGMRSADGLAGIFASGYGRMFILGGPEIWKRSFSIDEVRERAPHLDPFLVGQDPDVFRRRLAERLDALGAVFAQDLSPRGRESEPPDQETPTRPEAAEQQSSPPGDGLDPGELPPPDAPSSAPTPEPGS